MGVGFCWSRVGLVYRLLDGIEGRTLSLGQGAESVQIWL